MKTSFRRANTEEVSAAALVLMDILEGVLKVKCSQGRRGRGGNGDSRPPLKDKARLVMSPGVKTPCGPKTRDANST